MRDATRFRGVPHASRAYIGTGRSSVAARPSLGLVILRGVISGGPSWVACEQRSWPPFRGGSEGCGRFKRRAEVTYEWKHRGTKELIFDQASGHLSSVLFSSSFVAGRPQVSRQVSLGGMDNQSAMAPLEGPPRCSVAGPSRGAADDRCREVVDYNLHIQRRM